MEKELGVKIIYRNSRMEPTNEEVYSLTEYTEMLRADLLRMITDIEDTMYAVNGNRQKSEWSDETWAAFCRIKHKLLDKAGDIGRLPQTIFEREA